VKAIKQRKIDNNVEKEKNVPVIPLDSKTKYITRKNPIPEKNPKIKE